MSGSQALMLPIRRRHELPGLPDAIFIDEFVDPRMTSNVMANIPDDDPLPDETWSLCHKLYPTGKKWPRSIAELQSCEESTKCNLYLDGATIKQDKNKDFILEFVINCSTQMSYIELRLRTHPVVNESDKDQIKRDKATRMSVFFQAWLASDKPDQNKRSPEDIVSDFSSHLYSARMMHLTESDFYHQNPRMLHDFKTPERTQGMFEFKSVGGIQVNTSIDVSHRPATVKNAVAIFRSLYQPRMPTLDIKVHLEGNVRLQGTFWGYFRQRPWPSPQNFWAFAQPNENTAPVISHTPFLNSEREDFVKRSYAERAPKFNKTLQVNGEEQAVDLSLPERPTLVGLLPRVQFIDERQYLAHILGAKSWEYGVSLDRMVRCFNGEHEYDLFYSTATTGGADSSATQILLVKIRRENEDGAAAEASELDLPPIGSPVVVLDMVPDQELQGKVVSLSHEGLNFSVAVSLTPVTLTGHVLEPGSGKAVFKFGHQGGPIRPQIQAITRMIHKDEGLGMISKPQLRDMLLARNNMAYNSEPESFAHLPSHWETTMNARIRSADRTLNPEQASSLRHALGHRLSLVVAPPGTGKTEVAFAFGSVIADLGMSFVFTAASNKATNVGLARFTKQEAVQGASLDAARPTSKRFGFFRIYTGSQEGIAGASEKLEVSTDLDAHDPLAGLPEEAKESLHDAFQKNKSGYPGPNSMEEEIQVRLAALAGGNFRPKYPQEDLLLTELKHTRADPLSTTQEQIKATLKVKRLMAKHSKGIFVTLTSIHSPILRNITPAALILEEQSQPLEADVVSAMVNLNRHVDMFLLVGDDKQLPPTVLDKNGILRRQVELSLFSRLLESGLKPSVLKTQYRMHPNISAWAQETVYRYPGLLNGPNTPHQPEIAVYRKWIQKWREYLVEVTPRAVIEQCILSHSIFISSDPSQQLTSIIPARSFTQARGTSSFNLQNALIDVHLAVSARGLGFQLQDICILTPYLAQVKLLRRLLAFFPILDGLNIVYTADASQGDEWALVILDLVKDSPGEGHSLGFISDYRRLNVALTRAKVGRIVVGRIGMTDNVYESEGIEYLRHLIESHVEKKWYMRIRGSEVEDLFETWMTEVGFKGLKEIVMEFVESEM